MGNFSRDTFDKLKHYVGVRLQQGVPLVDADWNEQEDIRKYELQAFLKWFVGNGVPKGNDGFCIEAIPAENDFWIKGGDGTPEGAGRCLVEGWDAINESNLKYTAQPLFNNPALAAKWGVDPVQPLTTPTTSRNYTVYLDVWEREVDAQENDNLVNPAIGIETCVRLKREWVVRVAKGFIPPEPPRDHIFYPLARLLRKGDEAMIERIADLRTTSLNMAALEAEIVDARGIKGNIGNRLDESLTKEGQLLHNVVGNDQVKADAAIEESKILFSRRGHDHRDGSQGKRIKHSSLHKDDGSNPHGITAADVGALVSVDGVKNPGGNVNLAPKNAITITPNDAANVISVGEIHSGRHDNPHKTTVAQIDTQGGTNRIVAQINARTGVIDKKRIDPGVGATGWVKLPFLPKKSREDTEFIHMDMYSLSGLEGATGNMEIPVPPGATRTKNFRIAGISNAKKIYISLYITELCHIKKTFRFSIEGAPFDELFATDGIINAETGYIALRVFASGASEICFVASEFE